MPEYAPEPGEYPENYSSKAPVDMSDAELRATWTWYAEREKEAEDEDEADPGFPHYWLRLLSVEARTRGLDLSLPDDGGGDGAGGCTPDGQVVAE